MFFCVGRNYAAHALELGNAVPNAAKQEEMVLFHKGERCFSQQLNATHLDETVHYEAELCFQVKGGQLTAVTVGLDLTKRQLQSTLKTKQLPWERAKAFSGSVVLAVWCELPAAVEWGAFELRLWEDGQLCQHGISQQMLYSPKQILEEVQRYSPVCDGDVLMTGTPEGVGALHAGKNYRVALYYQGELWLEQSWLAQ